MILLTPYFTHPCAAVTTVKSVSLAPEESPYPLYYINGWRVHRLNVDSSARSTSTSLDGGTHVPKFRVRVVLTIKNRPFNMFDLDVAGLT